MATAGSALAAWPLLAGSGAEPSAPVPVSHIDTATRACLLTSTDTDTAGTWAAMLQLAGTNTEHLIVQRYRIPTGVRPAAYVNSVVGLGCSTVVTTGHAARQAVASRLAEQPLPHVRFVLVGDRPLRGTTHLSPDAVSARTLSKWVTG
ncbi:hypothetical protein ABZT17_02695 [Streptomyces sp. NPDC005648]|uniref:hypothetical protein n=1 Tax=Streptomyces sp. NPDC005648 TaxID=3157044 RepID=UPI0033B85675